MVQGLSAAQTASLLQELPKAVREDSFLRRALVEHLADLDLEKAIETGQQLRDPTMVGIAVAALSKKDVVAAFLRASRLPDAEWREACRDMNSPVWGRGIQGNYSAFLDAIQFDPKLKQRFAKNASVFDGALGQLIATDPSNAAEAIRELRKLGDQSSASQSRVGVEQAYWWCLREQSAEAASAFLDRSPAATVSAWPHYWEAASRFKIRGLESALQYVEKQEKEENIRNAAGGLWGALVRNDPSEAYNWIRALPEGPVKEGTLLGVFWESQRSHGVDRPLIAGLISGAQKLSAEQQASYYIAFMKGMKDHSPESLGFQSWQEFIDRVPRPVEGLDSLIREIAPLK
jgi:hypothetical protein